MIWVRNVLELRYLNTWSPVGSTVWGRFRWHSSAGGSSLLGRWGWCRAFGEKRCAVSSLLSLLYAYHARQASSLPPPTSCWLLCHQSAITDLLLSPGTMNQMNPSSSSCLGHGALRQEQKSSSKSFINPIWASLPDSWLFPKNSWAKRGGCYNGQMGCQG